MIHAEHYYSPYYSNEEILSEFTSLISDEELRIWNNRATVNITGDVYLCTMLNGKEILGSPMNFKDIWYINVLSNEGKQLVVKSVQIESLVELVKRER